MKKNDRVSTWFAKIYNQISRDVSESDFVFMNHAYSDDLKLPFNLSAKDHKYRYHAALLAKTLRGISLSNKIVAEVGSGRGGNCSIISKYYQPAFVIGLDASAENINFSARNVMRRNVLFLEGDAHKLPFADNSIDVVLNLESAHCYSNPVVFFKEVERVLKRGGKFCYSDCVSGRAMIVVQQRLAQTSLRVVREEDITQGVVSGLKKNRKNLFRLLRVSKSSNPHVKKTKSYLIDSWAIAREAYQNGKAVYFNFLLEKI